MKIRNINFHGIGRPLGRDWGEGERPFWTTEETLIAVLDEAAANRDEIALSFDDGNSSDIDVVLPALQQRDLTATFFIVPSWLGEPSRLTKSELRRLADSGMTIGNHGLEHRHWPTLSPAELQREIREGRSALQQLTGQPVDTVAIPYGDYDDATLGALRQEPYAQVFTSDGGAADAEAWLQPREHIRAEVKGRSRRA